MGGCYEIQPPVGVASGGGGGLIWLAGDLAGNGSVATAPRVGSLTGVTTAGTPVVKVRNGGAFAFVAADAVTGVATVGDLRFRNGRAVVGVRNAGDTADYVAVATDAQSLYLGALNSAGSGIFGNTYLFASSNVSAWIGTTETLRVSAGLVSLGTGIALALPGAVISTTGSIRAPNNSTILASRNAANSANHSIIATDAANNLTFGQFDGPPSTFLQGQTVNFVTNGGVYTAVFGATSAQFRQPITMPGTAGTSAVASAGDIRAANNTNILMVRNAANSADYGVVGFDSSNQLYVGSDKASGNRVVNTYVGASNAVIFNVNGTTALDARSTSVSFGVQTIFTTLGTKHYWGPSATAPFDAAGSGTPEGTLSAPPGSTFRRTDGGGAGTTTNFYVKQAGTGNTGWLGIA